MKSPGNILLFFIGITLLFVFCRAEAALFTDDTSTTDKGHFDLEYCFDYYHEAEKEYNPETEDYSLNVSKETDLTLDLTVGLLANSDFAVTVPYAFIDTTSLGKANGFWDISTCLKYRFFEEKGIFPSFALTFDFKSDSGNDDKALGTGKRDYALNSIFTKNIGDNAFDLNLGYVFVGGKAADVFFYSTDWSRELFDGLVFCVELYGENTFEGASDLNVLSGAVSLDYQLTPMISIESGFAAGITKASPDYQFSGSVTFSF